MLKRFLSSSFLFAIIILTLHGCRPIQESAGNREVLFQYSTLVSLMEGVYDGEMTFAQLGEHGDFGLGTFNTLDGEMVALDGKFYQVKADGVAYPVDGGMKTPFSVVTFFDADRTIAVDEAMDCEQFKTYLDSLLSTVNIPYAIKVEGTFEYIKTRSVPAQSEPYPRLVKVLETQPTFEFSNVTGEIVGFRLPGYVDGANAPGYHFHFINQDRNAGGHLLECQLSNVQVEIDNTGEWYTVLPEDDAFYGVDLSGGEISGE